MKKAHARLKTPRNPQEVYDYLVDFERHPEWRFDVLSSELIGGETGRPGARYRQRVKAGPRETVTEVELTVAEPRRTVGFRTADEGPISVSGSYRIEAREGATHLTNEVVLEPRGFLRLFEPFMGPSIRKTAKRYEQELAARLGGAPTSST